MFLLLAEELPHARLPAAALVQGDASVLGAAPREPRALPSQDVHELLLGQALHLEHQRGQDRPCHVMHIQLQRLHRMLQEHGLLAPHLRHVVFVVTEIEVYVRVDAAELDGRSIVRPAQEFQD